MPICSECGSELVLKTARRGRNRGNQFWACPGWRPNSQGCNFRGRDVDDPNGERGRNDAGANQGQERQHATSSSDLRLPVQLRVRPKAEDMAVTVHQSLTLPPSILTRIVSGSVESLNQFLQYSQWRVDAPISHGRCEDSSIRQVLLVARKILTRGNLTLASPLVENVIRTHLGLPEPLDILSLDPSLYVSSQIQSEGDSHLWFDGSTGTERLFYTSILPELLGSSYRRWVLPQVYYSSLLSRSAIEETLQESRVDFLITTPEHNVVVELDGSEHEAHTERDDHKRSLLRQAGFEVCAIKNDEVESRSGPNLQRLFEIFQLDRVKSYPPAESQHGNYLNALKICHQLQVVMVDAMLDGRLKSGESQIIALDYSSTGLPNDLLQQQHCAQV